MADQVNVVSICGSLRKGSFNAALARLAPKLAPPGMAITAAPSLDTFPLYNHDVQDASGFPAAANDLAAAIRAADGVLICSPEYNWSVPGVLKNAIDHGSRPHGQNAWQRKPAGVIGVSPGAMGSALAQQHLRNVLAAVDMPTLAQPEAFIHAKDGVIDASGELGEATAKFVKGWLDAYLAFARKIAG